MAAKLRSDAFSGISRRWICVSFFILSRSAGAEFIHARFRSRFFEMAIRNVKVAFERELLEERLAHGRHGDLRGQIRLAREWRGLLVTGHEDGEKIFDMPVTHREIE